MKFPTCLQIASLSILSIAQWSNVALAEEMAEMHRMNPHQIATTPSGSVSNNYAALVESAMATMNTGMNKAPMTGDPDHDFASMMVPHHQGAVDMATVALQYGKDPKVKKLARDIIKSQNAEIAWMKTWLAKHSR